MPETSQTTCGRQGRSPRSLRPHLPATSARPFPKQPTPFGVGAVAWHAVVVIPAGRSVAPRRGGAARLARRATVVPSPFPPTIVLTTFVSSPLPRRRRSRSRSRRPPPLACREGGRGSSAARSCHWGRGRHPPPPYRSRQRFRRRGHPRDSNLHTSERGPTRVTGVTQMGVQQRAWRRRRRAGRVQAGRPPGGSIGSMHSSLLVRARVGSPQA